MFYFHLFVEKKYDDFWVYIVFFLSDVQIS